MSFMGLLTDRCDITHLHPKKQELPYGLGERETFDQDAAPDLTNIPCLFTYGSSGSLTVEAPRRVAQSAAMLIVPYDTDVRVNDTITDRRSGLKYTAEVPEYKRRHHIEVALTRIGAEASL